MGALLDELQNVKGAFKSLQTMESTMVDGMDAISSFLIVGFYGIFVL